MQESKSVPDCFKQLTRILIRSGFFFLIAEVKTREERAGLSVMLLSHRVTSTISNLYSFSLHELMPCYCPMAFLNTSNPTSTTHCSVFLTPFSWVMHVQLTKKMKQHCALRFRAALIEISVHLLAFNLVVFICFPFFQTGISASR